MPQDTEKKAFNRGYNSYRVDQAQPVSPYDDDMLSFLFCTGWLKAQGFFARCEKPLKSSSFGVRAA